MSQATDYAGVEEAAGFQPSGVSQGRQCYNHYMSIKDRVAIITGAGRGVGRATALRFAREGARIVLFSRTPAALDEVTSEITRKGYPVLPITGDVSHEEDVQALFQ